MSPQTVQQRQQTLRLQRLQVERERLRIRQRMIMKQVRLATHRACTYSGQWAHSLHGIYRGAALLSVANVVSS